MAVFVAMTTYPTIREATAPGSPSAFQAHFEQLWNASGAAPLRGYENVLVAMLAAADRPLYAELTSVDFFDPVSVEAGVETIRQWRLRLTTPKGPATDARPHTSSGRAETAATSSAACARPAPLRKTA
jgi:hypothetical protein